MTVHPLPLEGVRVADFGQLTAGANASAMLADLGADVIKIESARYLDLFRMWKPDGSEGWWNNSPHFHFTNRNKRGVSIDLKAPQGQALVLDLLRHCDILIENFSRGVLDRLGLGYAAVSAVNPAIVYASITSQGETGPYRSHRTYGSTLDAMSGISALMGYEGGRPEISGGDLNYPDQVVSLLATGITMAALRKARESGRGAHLDIAQREVVSFLLGEEILAASDTGKAAAPRGNREPGIHFQACLRARDTRWVAITLATPSDAARLADLIGAAPTDPTDALADWVGEQDADAVVEALSARGVAVAVSNDGHAMLADRRLLGGSIAWSEDGALLKGMPYRIANQPFAVRQPAPDLGEHTDDILSTLLGLSRDEIAQLEADGILSTAPAA